MTDPGESCYDVDGDQQCMAEDICPDEYFNDLLGKGECGLANLCKYDGVNLPSQPKPDNGPYWYNFRLNGKAATSIKVAAGEKFLLTYDWQRFNPENFCPTCLDQLYVGWAGAANADCFTISFGYAPAVSGVNRNVTLTAPAQPGVYFLSRQSDPGYSCSSSFMMPTEPSLSIAAICVQ
jgi:hypothetical protein